MAQNKRAKADALFSQYIRRYWADDNGIAECATCGNWLHYKDLDCGHYLTRAILATRYDVTNAAPQCRPCNRLHDGKADRMRQWLVSTYGEKEITALERRSKDPLIDKANVIYENAITLYLWALKQPKNRHEEIRLLSR
jgi:hypothetical protein